MKRDLLRPLRTVLPVSLVLALASHLPNALAADEAALRAETRKTAVPVLPKVVQAMQEALKEKGTVDAIPICREKAPQLLQDIRRQTGWNIRRISLQTRHPETGTPDVWEARQLADFNIKAANGVKPETLEAGEIVTTADGRRVYRYIKALPVAEVCVSCHGAAETFSDDLKAALRKDYPLDRATGYSVGQVRGALSVIRSL
ncbi:MAG TPA: DUF3365 domain-containing protein [Accumulibacter sp.]|nr:DUF3365 domain-containing protein [Accumulibacter sp.]HPP47591.1 DUF3365 domain-containing protein [Accumulibacter sp.]